MGYSPWSRRESDMTEQLHFTSLEIESLGRSRRDNLSRTRSLGRSRRDDLLGPPDWSFGVPKVSSVTSTG